MKPLEIAVVIESRDDATGMVAAILRELEGALQAYLASGKTHVIDLATLPLGAADRAALQQGQGSGREHSPLPADHRTHADLPYGFDHAER